ncbi:MAG: putative rRNA maturation factor [Candidatus Latescibacterota bacterium]|jgi:probable rRNA maturation factor
MDIHIMQLVSRFQVDCPAIEQVISALVVEFNITQDLTYVLTDDSHLHQLNRDFRNKDMPTDVLSFEMYDDIHPTSPLGEVYISLDRAREQAREAGLSLQQEVLHLAIHGTLHLLGFEHETDAGHRQMHAKERQYLPHH